MNIEFGAARPGLVAMRVGGLALDPESGDPILLLTDASGEKLMPIGIGRLEATAIVLGLQKTPTPRPLTHDMMKTLLAVTHTRVRGVVIHDVRDHTFIARVELDTAGGAVDVDARPSDGIALALRTGAPLYVAEHILPAGADAEKKGDGESLKTYVDNLKPSDFLGA